MVMTDAKRHEVRVAASKEKLDLQVSMGNRNVFQVAQATSENQIISWYQPKCCFDPDMGGDVLLLVGIVDQV
jgi:hypothetical protein